MATYVDGKPDVSHAEMADSPADGHQTQRVLSAGHEADLKAEYNGGRIEDSAAAGYIDATVVITPEENKRLRNKIYKNLLPVMCVAYITQSLDKGTLGTSAIMGWQTDVGAVGQDYALTSTMLWIGIIIGEPLVNQFCRRLPVAKVLGISMVIWSILVLGLAFSLNIGAVFAIRALLGFFESSFAPCLVTITVQWFTTNEQAQIITYWQVMFSIAGIVSNILAYGFYHITGQNPLRGWQWMTVCIALISFVASIIVLVFLPDTPIQARWASDEDKTKFVERVRGNDQGIKQKKFKKDQAIEAFTDPFTWLLFFMMFFQTLVVGGLNTFNSILINSAFGFDVLTSLLVSIPLSAFQAMLYFLIGFIVTKTRQTILCIIAFTVVNIAGTVVLITVAPSTSTRGGLLAAFYFMQCFQSVNPSMYAMVSRNVAGQTKKSIVYALFFIAWAGGNAIGPQLFQAAWKPRYFNTLYIHLGIYVGFIGIVVLMRVLLKGRNDKRDKAMRGGENLHLHAFEDMTDLQNPEFRYCY